MSVKCEHGVWHYHQCYDCETHTRQGTKTLDSTQIIPDRDILMSTKVSNEHSNAQTPPQFFDRDVSWEITRKLLLEAFAHALHVDDASGWSTGQSILSHLRTLLDHRGPDAGPLQFIPEPVTTFTSYEAYLEHHGLQGRDPFNVEFDWMKDRIADLEAQLAKERNYSQETHARLEQANDEISTLRARLVHRHIIGKVYDVTRESINRLAGELDEVRAERDRLRELVKDLLDEWKARKIYAPLDQKKIYERACKETEG